MFVYVMIGNLQWIKSGVQQILTKFKVKQKEINVIRLNKFSGKWRAFNLCEMSDEKTLQDLNDIYP